MALLLGFFSSPPKKLSKQDDEWQVMAESSKETSVPNQKSLDMNESLEQALLLQSFRWQESIESQPYEGKKTVTSTTRPWIQPTPQWMRLRRGGPFIEPGSGLSKRSLIKSKKQQLEYIWHWILDPTQTFELFVAKRNSHCISLSRCHLTMYLLNCHNLWSEHMIKSYLVTGFQTASYHQPVNNFSTPCQLLLVLLKIHDCPTCMLDINCVACSATTKCESCSGCDVGKVVTAEKHLVFC